MLMDNLNTFNPGTFTTGTITTNTAGKHWNFCPEDGQKLEADWIHCPKCGATIGYTGIYPYAYNSLPTFNIPPFPAQERCMFDGLPPGVYGLACTCPKCSPRCVDAIITTS